MPLTVIVRSAGGEERRLTFDSTQRIVIGRGPGSDVRLPESSVSYRHATIRAQGADFVVVDEGSTNGTFVGDVRIAPNTSRIVQSGDVVRVGRLGLEVRIDQSPITRDVATATRDLALALVSQAMAARGADRAVKVRVVEGGDQGAGLSLVEDGRTYVIGRAAHCDLTLTDSDASREHVRVQQLAGAVFVRDLKTKNGTWIGDARAPADRDALWRPAQMMRIGRTVLALLEPVSDALALIEREPDEPLALDEVAAAPPPPTAQSSEADRALEPPKRAPVKRHVPSWTVVDIAVTTVAVGILALSLAGLVWLLRG